MDFTWTVCYILHCPCILLLVTKRKNNVAKGEHDMKKVLAIILSMVLSLTLLAACGGNESTSSSGSSSESKSQSSSSSEGQAAALSGTLTLGGSTSVEKVIQSMMEAYMAENPDVTITYAPTGSGAGIEGAGNGSLDIGLSSRALKDEEKSSLTETTFALDGIAIVVNNANTVENLDMETLAKIYTGEITNWSEVGGPDSAIVVVGRDAASGTRDGFESIVGVKESCVYAEEQASTGAVLTSVQSNEGAIGYVSLASVSEDVKTLTIDGVAPSEETVKDGSYQIQRPFVFVTPADGSNELVKAFIDWAVSSATTELVANAGAVPVA